MYECFHCGQRSVIWGQISHWKSMVMKAKGLFILVIAQIAEQKYFILFAWTTKMKKRNQIMAAVNDLTVNVRLVPDEYTMNVILHMLNLWQDSNPDRMVALVPQKDRYGYEIINRGGKKDED